MARFRRSVLEAIEADWRVGRWWDLAIGRVVPIQAVALLCWWMYLSATSYAPDSWYDPT